MPFSLLTKLSLSFALALSLPLVSSAVCLSDAANTGCIHFEWKASDDRDVYTYSPSSLTKSWLQSHFYRINGYTPYWDGRISWFPNSWFYRDSSSLYTWDDAASNHPDWVLKNSAGEPLFINYGCSGASCPQYAPNYSNEEFRAWWIAEAKKTFAAGYKGIYVDDVNLIMELTTGWSVSTPIDPNTGSPMTLTNWKKYIAGFMTEIRQAFPNKEIVHNAIWYAGNGDPSTDTYVKEEVKAANYINIERGMSDKGLGGNGGFWSIQNLMSYVDQVHSLGSRVLLEQFGLDGEFSVAGYFLVNSGNDLFAMQAVSPDYWPSVYNVNLGSAKGSRYSWNGLIRRDFSGGMVLMNPPERGTVTVNLPGEYVTTLGNVVNSITLSGRQGKILRNYDTLTAASSVMSLTALAEGAHMLSNRASGMFLDAPNGTAFSGARVVQWPYTGGANQNWEFISLGSNLFKIKNSYTGLYLTAPTALGLSVRQQTESSSDSQVWAAISTGSGYNLVNKETGRYLADPGGADSAGVLMVTWTPTAGAEQEWMIQ